MVRPSARTLALVTLALLAVGARGKKDPVPAPAPPPAAPPPAAVPAAVPGAAAFCSGEYADDLSVLSSAARERERAQPPSTFCVRTTAVYECPYYAPDGTLRRSRQTVVAHGTAFGYKQQGSDTLLVTNQHVAEWPAVTDADHKVDDVPGGCRRVSDSVKIVDDEEDAYERDDIPLARVVSDAALDIAILRAHTALAVLPWRIGRSAALRERNAVEVRGFPLGILRAGNAGKVISAYDHDSEREWDHDDFVVDALLSPGNSGSPVLAVSCKTGEFELVGVYHAGYARGSALNVVVGVDQIRDLLTTQKRGAHPRVDAARPLDGAARALLVARATDSGEAFFPFGPLVAGVRARADGALAFEILPRTFPARTVPLVVLEDLPADTEDAFGVVGRVWAGNAQGLRAYAHADLDAEAQAQVARILDALRRDAVLAVQYRTAARLGASSRARFDEVTRLERTLARASAGRAELAQTADDLAQRLCPDGSDASGSLADALAVPPPPAPKPEEAGVVAAVPASASAPADSPSASVDTAAAGAPALTPIAAPGVSSPR